MPFKNKTMYERRFFRVDVHFYEYDFEISPRRQTIVLLEHIYIDLFVAYHQHGYVTCL